MQNWKKKKKKKSQGDKEMNSFALVSIYCVSSW